MKILRLLCFIVFQYAILTTNVSAKTGTFLENMGQWDSHIKYQSNFNGVNVFFMEDGLSFSVRQDRDTIELMYDGDNPIIKDEYIVNDYLIWNLNFVDRNIGAEVLSREHKESNINYLLGNDPTEWIINTNSYDFIQYNNIYNNIDLEYYLKDNQLKYDYIIHPGGNVSDIKLQYEGIIDLYINDKNQLVVSTIWGENIEEVPYTYQIVDGEEVEVESHYVLLSENTFGFVVCSDYDRTVDLIVDPFSLTWCTYMDFSTTGSMSSCDDMVRDPVSGDYYMTGKNDNGIPTTAGKYQTTYGGGNSDAYVTRFKPDGITVVWTTYIGGNLEDWGSAITVDAGSNNIYLTGRTAGGSGSPANHFPRVSAYQNVYGGGVFDAFILKLTTDGVTLVWSTYFGGSEEDRAGSIALNDNDDPFIGGTTASADFPAVNGYDLTLNNAAGNYDGMYAKFDVNGNLIYSSYFGGTSTLDYVTGIDVSNDELYAIGYTGTGPIPIVGGWDGLREAQEGFVFHVNQTGNGLVYSSYIGGDGGDTPRDIDVHDGTGEAYIVGTTGKFFGGNTFPVTGNAYDGTYNGSHLLFGDCFVSIVASDGSGLVYSSFVGGAASAIDDATGILATTNKDFYVTGYSHSGDFPATAGQMQSVHAADGGEADLFIAHFDYATGGLACGEITFWGGNAKDRSYGNTGLMVDQTGVDDTLIMSFTTWSTNLATTAGKYQPVKINGGSANSQAGLIKFWSCPQLLPVEMTDFRLRELKGNVELLWTTETEVSNAGWEVHRSTDGIEFENIGYVVGNGNTNTTHTYNFIDKNVEPFVLYYYRLKQIDWDFKIEYTHSLTIMLDKNTPFNVYPNPVETIVNISVQNSEVHLYDLSGKLVDQTMITNGKYDVSEFSNGSYVLKVKVNNVTKHMNLIINK